MRILYLSLFLFFGSQLYVHAQIKEVRFEAVEQLMKTQKKPLIIFIHTSWCTYCKAMEAVTFKDKSIVEKLNRDFYFIRLNAEEKREIKFLNRVFGYRPTGPETGVHELAQELGNINGKISYPSLCVLNTKYEIAFQHNAYMNAKTFLKLLDAISTSRM